MKIAKTNSDHRLTQYAAAAAGLLAIPLSASAGIIYTDIDPDTTLTNGGQEYFIDMDGDNNDDVRIGVFHFKSTFTYSLSSHTKFYAQGLNSASLIADASSYGKKLVNGSLISSGMKWRAQGTSTYMSLGMGYFWSSASSSSNWVRGPWPGGGDHYLGVKFDISGRKHHGWIRLNMTGTADALTIKDFAYSDIADVSILAGQTALVAADTIQSIYVADTSDQANGNDLWVAFDMVADETIIDGYRIFVVKSADAGTFDLDSANNVASGNYLGIPKIGNNIGLKAGAVAKDVNGVLITNNEPYKIFAMVVANQFDTHVNSLSDPSSEITLTTIALPATNVVAKDSTDAGDASDIYLTFDASINENVCAEYWAIVSKAAVTLDMASAEGLASDRYQKVTKTGSSQALLMDASLKDSDGDAVVNGSDYKVYILSVADQIVANTNALSDPSASFTLESTAGIQTDGNQEIRVFDFNGSIEMFTPMDVKDAQVKLFDLSGKMIWSDKFSGTHFTHDAGNEKTGIYILNLESDRGVETWKLFLN